MRVSNVRDPKFSKLYELWELISFYRKRVKGRMPSIPQQSSSFFLTDFLERPKASTRSFQ